MADDVRLTGLLLLKGTGFRACGKSRFEGNAIPHLWRTYLQGFTDGLKRLRKNATGVPQGRLRVAQDEILGRFENMIQSRRDD
jgi:hypothetical protein